MNQTTGELVSSIESAADLRSVSRTNRPLRIARIEKGLIAAIDRALIAASEGGLSEVYADVIFADYVNYKGKITHELPQTSLDRVCTIYRSKGCLVNAVDVETARLIGREAIVKISWDGDMG